MSVRTRPAKPRYRRALLWVLLGLYVTAVIIIATGDFRISLDQAWHQATQYQPETFTELAFDQPGALPHFAPAGRLQHVPFHITNHEDTTRQYTYHVTITMNGHTTVQQRTITVANGATSRQTVTFAIPQANQIAMITIRIDGSNQQLTIRSQS